MIIIEDDTSCYDGEQGGGYSLTATTPTDDTSSASPPLRQSSRVMKGLFHMQTQTRYPFYTEEDVTYYNHIHALNIMHAHTSITSS